MPYIDIEITAEMLDAAAGAVEKVKVNRTVASPYDTLAGLIGELAFAQWFLGDWRLHNLFDTKGKADFLDRIEVKTSAFPFRDTLNLLVREDYAAKRKPEAYVQTIINIPNRDAPKLEPGLVCRIAAHGTGGRGMSDNDLIRRSAARVRPSSAQNAVDSPRSSGRKQGRTSQNRRHA